MGMEVNGVTFLDEENNNTVANIRIVPGKPQGMLLWLVEKKIAKNGRQAEYILLIIGVVALVLTGFFIFSMIQNAPHPTDKNMPLGPARPTPLRTR